MQTWQGSIPNGTTETFLFNNLEDIFVLLDLKMFYLNDFFMFLLQYICASHFCVQKQHLNQILTLIYINI